MKPRYIHDCSKCRFLGTYKQYDLYACGNSRIARRSDDGPDYISMSTDVIETVVRSSDEVSADTEVLLVAYVRAHDRKLLGVRLRAIHNRAIAAGMKLLTEDEVLEEVKRR